MVLHYNVGEYVAASFNETPSGMTGFLFLGTWRRGEKVRDTANGDYPASNNFLLTILNEERSNCAGFRRKFDHTKFQL